MEESKNSLKDPRFKPIFTQIVGNTISWCWFLMLGEILTRGRRYDITSGSLDFEGNFRLSMPLVVEMHTPSVRPLAPYIPEGKNVPAPTTEEAIQEYMKYLLSREKQPNEHYTYGEDLWWQVEEVIKYYKRYGFGNACCHMVVGRPESFLFYNREVDYTEFVAVEDRTSGKLIFSRHITNTWNKDLRIEVSSQCLRGVDTWVQNGRLYFCCYFRSQDAWAGFPQNYGGLQLVKEYMASCLNLEDGPLIAISKDLHFYRDNIPYGLEMIGKKAEELSWFEPEVRL
ncbi:MAG: thymidylate synthase [Candidatus Pacebacteria bacterium]|nr:thymidylate synthase [Candidatus Paceibacterota bacterium]